VDPGLRRRGKPREGVWVAEVTDLADLTACPRDAPDPAQERPHPGTQLRCTDVNGLPDEPILAWPSNSRYSTTGKTKITRLPDQEPGDRQPHLRRERVAPQDEAQPKPGTGRGEFSALGRLAAERMQMAASRYWQPSSGRWYESTE
jgi:hypothetical protein